MRTDRLFAGRRLVLAVLLGAGAAGCHAKAASAEQARQQMSSLEAARPSTPAATPWWAAFNEPALAALQGAARAQGDGKPLAVPMQVDAQVTAAYIAARILNVRWTLVKEFGESLSAQTRLLAAAPAASGQADALAAITAQRAEAERFAVSLQHEREAALAALAQWCHLSTDAVARLMGPAFAMRELPLFDAPAPTRLPRAVLRARADVSAAERRLLLARKSSGSGLAWQGSESVLSGWIELDAQAADTPSGAALDTGELMQVAMRAEGEVRAQLRALQRRSEEAAKRLEIVRMRRVELEATLRRMQLGAGSASEAAQDYRLLLVDNDRLAVAGGELAYSWIALQLSTAGGALQPQARMQGQ